ncbi:MAG: flavodoxin family protein [Candidatus Bathyarchaeia archaeon]
MKKSLKIIITIIAILVIIFAVFAVMFVLDISAYTATGSQTLTPEGTSTGTALVLYDPGYSGAATRVAEQVAIDLQTKGYKVTLAGIKSGDAKNTDGYDIIVIGGPIYAGVPTVSVKDALNNLNPDTGVMVGVYGSGSGTTSPEDIKQIIKGVPALGSDGALSNAIVVKIGEKEDLNARAEDFVNQLTTQSAT